jgi:hypothetical protein
MQPANKAIAKRSSERKQVILADPDLECAGRNSFGDASINPFACRI